MNPVYTMEKELAESEGIVNAPKIKLSNDEERVLSFFDSAAPVDWEDWRWQIRNRIRTKEVLSKIIKAAKGIFQKKDQFSKLIDNGFRADFRWDKSAKEYQNLYQCLLSG